MFGSLVFVALTAIPANLDALSPAALYDLDCIETGAVLAEKTDSESMRSASNIMAIFYLGRLSARYREGSWGDILTKYAVQDAHDVTWHLQNGEHCFAKMTLYSQQ